jgi:outer membrane protein
MKTRSNPLGKSELLAGKQEVRQAARFDYTLNDNWLVNASVRHIDIETDASMNSALGKVTTKVDLAPWVYTLALAYRF